MFVKKFRCSTCGAVKFNIIGGHEDVCFDCWKKGFFFALNPYIRKNLKAWREG